MKSNNFFFYGGVLFVIVGWFALISQVIYIFAYMDNYLAGFKTIPVICLGYSAMIVIFGTLLFLITTNYISELIEKYNNFKDNNKYGKLV